MSSFSSAGGGSGIFLFWKNHRIYLKVPSVLGTVRSSCFPLALNYFFSLALPPVANTTCLWAQGVYSSTVASGLPLVLASKNV